MGEDHGAPWKTWPCQGPEKWDNLQGWGLENTGGISGDLVTHMGALKGSAVSRKLEGAGIPWGYMATHRDSEGWGLHAKVGESHSLGNQD